MRQDNLKTELNKVKVKKLHEKPRRKSKKMIRRSIIVMLVGGVIVGISVYMPIQMKYKNLLEKEVIAGERFDSKIKVINDFKYIKDHVDEIYTSNDKIEEIKKKILEASNEISNGVTEKLEGLVADLSNMVNEISISNEMELQGLFDKINEDKLEGFNEEEVSKVNSYINEFNDCFKNKQYKKSKEILDALSTYISDIKKIANERRIKEIYEKKSKEDSSLREPKYINGILLVNKEFGLPDNFGTGESQEARVAFEQMKADASKEGIYLHAFSTYRSYWSQNRLYWNYASSYGQDPTDTFSAKPGFSEHQTGLAFDIGGTDRSLWAENDFKYTKEAEWLKNNSHKYGFILRYPEGKEWKTGFMFESWHFRYIGVEHSKHFENSNLTLEEYLGV